MCLNRFVIFLMSGLKYVNVVRVLVVCGSIFVCSLLYVVVLCLPVYSMKFGGIHYFLLLFVWYSILFVFSPGFNGRERIRERQYLYAAVLCSTGWFDVWWMVVSVVVGFLYMLISKFCVFLVICRSRKFIVLLVSWVGLNLMSLCT